MAYLLLELDTTAPQLEIYAPSYTTRSSLTPITIQSNELLSSYQEVYIVDSNGVQHDLTFAHEGNSLVGSLYLNGYPIGITTIYVRLKDIVDNLSSLYSHSFTIMESVILTAQMNLTVMNSTMTTKTMKQELSASTMKNKMNTLEQNNNMIIRTMKNELEVVK